MARQLDDFRIDIDLGHAEREAARIRDWLSALRKRHDLSRYEFTRIVQIVPGGSTFSHPILTLGTRFTETEDLLLATYLHEQMHWYLWRLGGPDVDPIAPFFDELVRRYPKAPIKLPEGARNYEQTYLHLVVCWLELAALAELIGRERAEALADTQWGYRWIYRTVIKDWDDIERLLRSHKVIPIRTPDELRRDDGRRRSRRGAGPSAASRKSPSAAKRPPAQKGRRKSPARGDRLRG